MNRFEVLNEKEINLVEKAGYTIDKNKEYSKQDYEKCANVICEYIMSHSKNEIPKIEMEFSSVLRKIV